MALDCDASTAGIQQSCSYGIGAPFVVEVHVTNAGAGYGGYQAKLGWTDAFLNYRDGTKVDTWGLPSGLQCQLPTAIDSQPAVAYVLAACASFSNSTHVGGVVQLGMECQSPVTDAPLTLVPPSLQEAFGSSLFAVGGAPIPTGLTSASITCLLVDTPTPAATATATPTTTATATPGGPTSGAMAVDCDGDTPLIIDESCSYSSGATFRIAVHATDPDGGYVGYQAKVRWTDAVLHYDAAADPATENQWPVSCVALQSDNQPGDPSLVSGCVSFPTPVVSTHTGPLTQLEMHCEASGTTLLTLVSRQGQPGDPQGSHFLDALGAPIDPALANASVTCESGDTATPPPTATGTITPPPTATPTSGPTFGAMAVDCDASTGTIDTNCSYGPGQEFDIIVHATDPYNGYIAYQAKVAWNDPVLDYLPANDPATEDLWPVDCTALQTDNQPADPSLLFGCVQFVFPPAQPIVSMHIGALARFHMQCQPGGGMTPLTLVRTGDVQLGSHFIDASGTPFQPALSSASVTCDSGATATPTVTPTATATASATVTPTSGPTFGAMAVDCDATTGTIETTCSYGPGQEFDIIVHATDPHNGYIAYQAKVAWNDPVLDYLPANDPATEDLWPVDCTALQTDNQPADPSLLFGCVQFVFPPAQPIVSMHIGALARFHMQCQPGGGTTPLILVRTGDVQLGSHFLDASSTPFQPALTSASVTCDSGATATPTATGTATVTPTATITPTAGPVFGGMAVDCDASTGTMDTNCSYGSGQEFDIIVHATDPYNGYVGYQAKVRWDSPVLEYKPTADAANENQWPVMCVAAHSDDQPTTPSSTSTLISGCVAFPLLQLPSTYTGPLTLLHMRCEAPGTTALALVSRQSGPQGSHFLDASGVAFDPALANASVTCGSGPTVTPAIGGPPTATPTRTRTATQTPTPTSTPSQPNLVVTGSDSPDPASSDAQYQYTLLVENIGLGAANGVVVEDVLPEVQQDGQMVAVTPVLPLPAGCSYDSPTRTVSCQLGGIPAGQSSQVDLVVRAPMTLARGPENNLLVDNCATVDPQNTVAETNEGDNGDCEPTTILWNCPDLSGDGAITLADVATVAFHWRHAIGIDEDGDNDAADRAADFDQNGAIGLGDIALVVLHWRETCS